MITEASIVAGALALFIVALFKPIKRFALAFLDMKIQVAIKDLEDAKNLKAEAQSYLKLAKLKLAEAENVALAIVDKAEAKSNQIIASVEEEVRLIAERKAADSLARITQQERQIATELKHEAVELAMAHVQETLLRELNKDAQMSLITSSLRRSNKMKH